MTIEPVNDGGEIYSPAMGDGFDAREDSSRRAMLLLAGAFAFLLIIAIGLLKAYGPGTRADNEPPRILADTSPYKSTPENPGGAVTPNQDKTVYDVVSGDSRAEDVILAPAAEEPITVQPSQNQATVIVKKPEINVPAVSVPATPRQTQAAVATASSDYVVQVASLRSSDEANRGWTSLNNKVGDIIPSSLYADIKRADLGDRGVYYRLRVAGFSSKDAATGFCTRLKSRAQDCIVVKK